jgi:2-iminobutanoate/2-iminopropanoate deaminase
MSGVTGAGSVIRSVRPFLLPLNKPMRIKQINPKALYDGAPVGLSQAVVDLDSGLVFVSGQVDWDLEHRVSSDSVAGKLAGALEKLKIALHESGASVETLVQIRVFIRGELEEHMASIMPVLKGFLGNSRTQPSPVSGSPLWRRRLRSLR